MYTTKKSFSSSKNFTLPVDFSNCSDENAINVTCTNLFNDNVVFMNSVTGLLRDADEIFKNKPEDAEQFRIFMKSSRPEIQERIKTLKFIEENRDKFFTIENTLKRENVWAIMNYMSQNLDDLLFQMPKTLNQNIDLNYAVQEAITDDSFSFYNDNNIVKQNWNNLLVETRMRKKVQEKTR